MKENNCLECKLAEYNTSELAEARLLGNSKRLPLHCNSPTATPKTRNHTVRQYTWGFCDSFIPRASSLKT